MTTSATGPRTDAGKERSSLNAAKHGLRTERHIIPGEDPAEWDAFRDNIVKDLDPGNTIEHELAERIALQMWRLRRAARYEAEVAEDEFEQAKHDITGTIMGLHGDDSAANSIKDMKHCVDYAKAQLSLAETTLETARRLPKLQDHAVLDTLVAVTLLQTAGFAVPETREPVPTAGEVRHILASGLHMSQKDALAHAVSAAELRRAEAEKEIPFQQRRLDTLLEDVTRRAEANMRDQRLLHDKALDRVVRYEAHVSRQLNQARQMLRELKAERLAETAREAGSSRHHGPETSENGKPHPKGAERTARQTPAAAPSPEGNSFGNRLFATAPVAAPVSSRGEASEGSSIGSLSETPTSDDETATPHTSCRAGGPFVRHILDGVNDNGHVPGAVSESS